MYFAKVCIKTSKMESHELNKTLYTKARCPKFLGIYFTAHTQTVQGCVIVFPNVALVKVKECDERTII